MKKLFAAIVSLVLVLSLAASALADPIRVGIIQMADNGAFTDMREGYIDHMRELGYGEDDMVFDYRNAQGDMTNLVSICQAVIESGADYVVTIATPPTQAMAAGAAALSASSPRLSSEPRSSPSSAIPFCASQPCARASHSSAAL